MTLLRITPLLLLSSLSCHAFMQTVQMPTYVQPSKSQTRSTIVSLFDIDDHIDSAKIDLHRELSSSFSGEESQSLLDIRQKKWFNESMKYYASVSRKQNDLSHDHDAQDEENFLQVAGMHYFALTKVRNKEFKHAEVIYRKLIESSFTERSEKGYCDHSSLAVTTLLLALHLQRQGADAETTKKTREVFLRFFRLVGEDDVKTCSCSAKVLQAYALFEMKRGLSQKSLELIQQAISMDESLAPILEWNQFKKISQNCTRSVSL